MDHRCSASTVVGFGEKMRKRISWHLLWVFAFLVGVAFYVMDGVIFYIRRSVTAA